MRELRRSGGPTTAVAARDGVGWDSAEAWLLERPAGETTIEGVLPGFAGRAIAPGDELSWVWFPERTLPAGHDEPDEADLAHFWDATAAGLDVVLTDGRRLSDTAHDQYGAGLTPAAQAAAKTQWVDQWNRRAVDLTPFAGAVVDRLEARLGAAGGGCGRRRERPALRGWFDAVRIGPARPEPARPIDHVRTTRGTQSSSRSSRGNTAPVVGVPHGGVLGLPMTDASSSHWPYAYQEHARTEPDGRVRSALQGFATSHLPSPWMADRGVFQLMPSPLDEPDVDRTARALGFDHDDEQDGPHRYRVALDQGVTATMTAGEFALGFRFTGTRAVVLDHHGRVDDVSVAIVDGTAVVECLLDDRPGHPAAPRARPDRRGHVGPHGRPGRHAPRLGAGRRRRRGAHRRGARHLDGLDRGRPRERPCRGDVDTMCARAEAAWTAALGTLEVEGATPDQLVSLYSGLYRLFLFPLTAGETARDGVPRYRSPYGDPRRADPRRPGPRGRRGPPQHHERVLGHLPDRLAAPRAPHPGPGGRARRGASATSGTAGGRRGGVPPAPRTA